MNTTRIVLLALFSMVVACGGHQAPLTRGPTRPSDDAILVLREVSIGQVEASWQPPSLWRRELEAVRQRSRMVFVSNRPRDCDQEQLECHQDCMSRKPPYPHGARLGHGHVSYCDNKCLNSYMDCLKARQSAPLLYESEGSAANWFRDHPEALVLGGVVVVAGVSFVVISVGAGLLVLAPLALL